jgi:hypothetical protein
MQASINLDTPRNTWANKQESGHPLILKFLIQISGRKGDPELQRDLGQFLEVIRRFKEDQSSVQSCRKIPSRLTGVGRSAGLLDQAG